MVAIEQTRKELENAKRVGEERGCDFGGKSCSGATKRARALTATENMADWKNSIKSLGRSERRLFLCDISRNSRVTEAINISKTRKNSRWKMIQAKSALVKDKEQLSKAVEKFKPRRKR